MLVFVDGACASNGATDARAGVGIYFGPASKYNLSEAFTLQGVVTNQRAELHAVARAMEIVRHQVIPQRKQIIAAAAPNRDAEDVRDLVKLHLVIVTDSSYVVEGMCSYFKNWTYKESKQSLVNKKGEKVKNSEGFMRIKEGVEPLSMIGIQVEYYHVDREENAEADRLAKAATIKAT